jgi:teichuronic acid biosynthesis glycosyltransferase TuaC
MRILYVIPGRVEGNDFIFAKRQIESMKAAGVTTHNCFLRSRTSIPLLVEAIRYLRQEIAAFQPDIVHAQFGTMTGMVCICAGASPLIVTFRGGDLNPTREVSRLRSLTGRFLSQVTALRAAAIICVTAKLKARLWWRQERCSVIPSGLDLEKFAPMSRENARTVLSWDQADRVILFNAGRNVQAKRLDLALAAVECAKQLLDVRLEILRGQTPPEMIPLYLNAADCLLVTSDWEGSPNIVKEALACNLPIVAVDAGDIADRIAGVTPSFIAKRSPETLGQCLVKTLQENRRSNGRHKVATISDKAIAQEVLELYRRVISESQGAALAVSPGITDPSRNS